MPDRDPPPRHLGDVSDPDLARDDGASELERLALVTRNAERRAGLGACRAPLEVDSRPASACCKSSATDARMSRMADPASHAGDAPAVLRVSLDPGARLPTRATEGSVGLDLFPPEGSAPRLMPHETRVFDTGVRVEIPPGYVGKVEGRSGMSKRGVAVSGGILDPDYRGSVGVILTNHGLAPWMAEPGKAIAQLVLYSAWTPAVMVVEGLGETARGENGFGSSDSPR